LHTVPVDIDSLLDVNSESNFVKNAAVQKLVKRQPDCVFLRTRAIGNLEVDGPNTNWDAFPYGEFLNEKPGFGYKSFIGRKAFIEHQSDSINNSIGDLIDAYLNKFELGTLSTKTWYDLNDKERLGVLADWLRKDKLGSNLLESFGYDNCIEKQTRDGSIEVLMRIDRARAPKIARQIDLNEKIGVSMGTAISYSECSVCGNRAYYEKDYCDHIAYGKGRPHIVNASGIRKLVDEGKLKPEWLRFVVQTPNDLKAVINGDRRTVQATAFEINYGLQFYELSVVSTPAYLRGYALEKVARQLKNDENWLSVVPDDVLILLKQVLMR